MTTVRFSVAVLIGTFGVAAPAVAQEADEIVEVIGRTPLGAAVGADQIAANVQQVSGETIAAQHPLALSEFMQRNLGSVFVNEAQSNPLQPDVQYRGFVGSPLLGLAQGIAVYQDGVRLNEPFGDTVNWALIPDSAVDSMALMPGSNPLFGLNALGGAISIQTRDGFTSPGTTGESFGGSFGRRGLTASNGGAGERFGYFVTGEYLKEDGWRDFSPTEAIQLFGKLGWLAGPTRIDLSLAVTETDLIGNGPAPVELLAIDRKSVFTRPDITENELALANLSIDHEVSESFALSGNFYLRSSDISSLNGDDSDFEECEDSPGFICEEEDGDEELLLDSSGDPIVASEDLEGAAVNRTDTAQDGIGFGLQGNWQGTLGSRENRFVAGIVYDDSSIHFNASTELGSLDATRFAVPGAVFVGESFTRLAADTSNLGLFVSNTLALTEQVHLTVSGRYNDTNVTLRDRIGTALNGDHQFDRFNLAVGVTAKLSNDSVLYAGVSQSSRAPSPVELTCADEDDPCRLPNAFLADPPLEQVVAQTIEAGIRGHSERFDWHAGAFRTTSRDDILFVSAGALTGQGFFDNVGKTRRDGIELSFSLETANGVRWFGNYTWLDATFLETLVFASQNNPAAIAGEVSVQPGDRLPLIPNHLFKAGFDLPIGTRTRVGANLYAGAGFPMRGDEGNDLGTIGRHAALNIRADYRVTDNTSVYISIDNLLDREYETFGLFGEPDEVLGDEFEDPRFLSPGAPRAAWVGIRVTFD